MQINVKKMIKLNYIIIDLLIIAFPLIFSFKWKFKYYKFFKPLAASITIVGLSYILWDILVTMRGDWWFEEEFLIGIEIFVLPIEEILFFIVVPFACIFIYENLEYFVKDKKISFNKWFYLALATIFVIVGIIFWQQDYTILSMFSCALFFIIASVIYPQILKSRNYWFYIILSFIPFIIFNYLLTSLIVVSYNPDAIWGGSGAWNGRIFTIPIEDFFYNFSMLSFYLLIYLYFKEKWGRQKKIINR
jgi:lycopene cyclase domain-containing protein